MKHPAAAVDALSYASNIRDVTEGGHGGWYAYPAHIAVVRSTAGALGFPFGYPGAWGAGEYLTVGFRPRSRSDSAPY